MQKNRVWAVILPFCLATALAGCVTAEKRPEVTENTPQLQTESMQAPAGTAAEQQMEKMEEPGAAVEPEQAPAEDPCKAVVAELANQARATMKTANGSCEGRRIEVNPLWSVDYDGAVRVRIYDSAGMLQSTEDIKP